jgi:hypothetical protein
LVQDENGQPLAGATVRATPTGVVLIMVVPNTRTDENGRFCLAGLLPVHTCLHAFKEDAFYPHTGWNVWNEGQGSAQVDVPAGGAITGIVLKVSPAARIDAKAFDAVTGDAIPNVGLHIERDGSPGRYVAGGGRGEFLVPTEPIRVRIDAPRYESAWYSEGNGQPAVLRLAPRQILTVTVRLRKATCNEPLCFSGGVFIPTPPPAYTPPTAPSK